VYMKFPIKGPKISPSAKNVLNRPEHISFRASLFW
jgi:hypothetical protein